MKRSVRYAGQAISDIAGVVAWLTQPGAGPRAQRRLQRITSAIERLADHPTRYPSDRQGRREFTVEGHRVRYRVKPDTGNDATAGNVLMLRVFGPGQARERP